MYVVENVINGRILKSFECEADAKEWAKNYLNETGVPTFVSYNPWW